MAKTSGSTRKKFGNDNFKASGGKWVNFADAKPLSSIKDTKLRREIQQGISKFESRLGIGTTEIRVGEIEGAYGIHFSAVNNGESKGILLSDKYFGQGTVESVVKDKKKAYESGWSTKTNKPVQHTIVHELGHSVWTPSLKSKNGVAAGREINKLWNEFAKNKPKSYGAYAFTEKAEMVAEMITKHVLGKSDKYSRKLISILAKNKLIKTKR